MVRLTIPAQLCFKDIALAAVLAAVDAEGVDAEGVDAERGDAKRVDAKRVDAKRVDAKRVDAKRVDAKRVDAKREGPGPEVRDQIVSALGEALNNVVLHAYRGIRGGHIDIEVLTSPGEVEIRMLDRGRGFDPESVAEYSVPDDSLDVSALDVSGLAESGMGLYIMRSFMDDVAYTRGGGGRPNVLVLRKRWHTAAGSTPGADTSAPRKESSQSGWRIRSVAVPLDEERIAGSLRRK